MSLAAAKRYTDTVHESLSLHAERARSGSEPALAAYGGECVNAIFMACMERAQRNTTQL